LSPKKEKTRRKIRNTSNDYADELKDKFDDALENLYKKYDVLKEDGQGLLMKENLNLKTKKILKISILKISVSKISIKIHLA
jgi:hypothetical protein